MTEASPGLVHSLPCEELSISRLPRQGLTRKLRWWLGISITTQLLIGALSLIIIQGPWVSQHRGDEAKAVSSLAASLLSDSVFLSTNPRLQSTLDEIAQTPGVEYAVITDLDGRVMAKSDPSALLPADLKEVSNGETTPLLVSTDMARSIIPSIARSVTETVGAQRTHRLILGTTDHTSQRVVFDGAVAIMLGALGTMAIVFPLMMWRARRSITGMRALHRAIRRLAKGIEPDPLAPTGDDEIAFLSVAFNSMAADIIANQNALRNANEQLEHRVAERTWLLREANAELQKSNAKLGEVTETALRFTNDVAHEFRTPLAVIKEFALIMEDGLGGEVSKEQSEYLAFISDATLDLAQLVDDFLDTGKLRAQRLPVDRRSYAPETLIDGAWAMLESRAKARGIRLERDISPRLPCVHADAEMARRALINIVVNAVKFSTSDETVRIEAVAHEDAVQIRVVDRGPGLAQEDIDTLFERFVQTTTGKHADSKGFGLGLNIAAELVSINLGTISVQSTLGEGSIFAFTLPIDTPDSILRSYLDHVREWGQSTPIVALRIIRTRETPGERDLTELLSDALYAQDINVAHPDSGIMVVGQANDAVAWRDRLDKHLNSNTDIPAIRVELVGIYPVNEVSAADLLNRTAPTTPRR